MIKLKCDIENDKQLADALVKLHKEFPKEMEKAYLRAGSIIIRKMKAGVKNLGSKDTGGKFQKLSDIRNALRPGVPPGGVLTTLASKNKETGHNGILRVQKHGEEFYCGYITKMQPAVSRWQDGGVVDLASPAVRHQLHRRLGAVGRSDIVIPLSDVQPERQVVDPITDATRKELPNWVLGNMNKIIDRNLTRLQKKNGRWRPF